MAVSLINNIQRYQGLIADTKPTSGVLTGAEYFETDSGRIWKYDGSSWKIYRQDIDQKTFSQCTLDILHHEIHEGDHYETTYIETVGASTAVTCMITAPGTSETHIVFDVESSNSGTFTWSEAPNATAGSAITAYGNNRIASTTVETVVVSGITYTSAGSILKNVLLGGSTRGNRSVGGSQSGRREWILNNSTKYLIRFVADNASTKVVMNTAFYEVR